MKNLIILTILISFTLFSWVYFIEPNCLTTRSYRIENKDLKGLKIVFVSDFHLKPFQEKRLIGIVNVINNKNPDLVLMGGDFVNGHKKQSSLSMPIIGYELSKIKTKYGIYSILGNHDWWQDGEKMALELKRNGINVLQNNNMKIDIGDKTLYIAGVEDLLERNTDVPKALKNTKQPTILLTHWPDIFPLVPESVDLTLAGHTHGGQVVFPFIGALRIPSMTDRKFPQGMFKENNKLMIVTKGIGTSILPIRFNCIPEIVVIDFI